MNNNRNENRLTENKQRRVPVGGLRDILTVFGKDPNFSYRFVEDTLEGGSRIARFKRGGWDFVRTDRDSEIFVGEEAVYKSKSGHGSIVRYPSGDQFLYLMQIPMEFFIEDQKAKADDIALTESSIVGTKDPDEDDGQYGSVKISRD